MSITTREINLKKVIVGGMLVLSLGLATLGGASIPVLQGTDGINGVQIAYADCEGPDPQPDLDGNCPPTPTPTATPDVR